MTTRPLEPTTWPFEATTRPAARTVDSAAWLVRVRGLEEVWRWFVGDDHGTMNGTGGLEDTRDIRRRDAWPGVLDPKENLLAPGFHAQGDAPLAREFDALPSRFTSTWVSRFGSARTHASAPSAIWK